MRSAMQLHAFISEGGLQRKPGGKHGFPADTLFLGSFLQQGPKGQNVA